MTPLGIKRLGLAALGLSFVTLVAIAVASYGNWRELREAAAVVVRARQVLRTNGHVSAHLRDAEAAERGFLLTGDPRYLEKYESAVASAREDLDTLVRVTRGEVRLAQLAANLRELGNTRLNQLAQAIEIRKTTGLAAALSEMEIDEADPIIDDVVALSAKIESDQWRSRERSWMELERSAEATRWLTLFGAAALAGLVVLGAISLGKAAATQEALTVSAAESRDLLRTTLYSIGDAVIATDRNGSVTMMNPVAERLTGYKEDEALGRPSEEVFRIQNEATRAEVESPIRRVLREGRIAGLANHTVLITRSGKDIPIDDSGAPIRGDHGELEGVVLVFRDVTERKKAGEALQQSEQRFRMVADSAPVMIWSEQPDGNRDYFNLPWLRFRGRTSAQEAGDGWKDGIHSEELPRYLELRKEASQTRSPYSIEYRLRRADGAYGWVLSHGVPRFGSRGESLGYIGSCVDIDEAKKAEEKVRQAAKLESLGVLAGGIAHDFNNLLVGILGSASLLEEFIPPDTPARELVDNVRQSSERAARLIREMLAYSGHGRFLVEPLDLSEQVREITALLRASIPKNVEVRLKPSERPPIINADAAQLQQIIMNLVINAAEAAAPDGGWVEITTSWRTVNDGDNVAAPGGDNVAPGEYVVLTVTDNGVGMDAETQSKIFDPFFTTKFTGRGLGLAAVSGIIRGHRGAIKVESEPGRGTRFQVFLPGLRVRADRPAAPASVDGAGKVLVVDDEEMVRRVARAALERAGYSVLVAGAGSEAVEILQRQASEVALVVLDVGMPEIGGESTLQRLREIRPDLPVVVSSGYSESDVRARFGQAVNGYLGKPYTVKKLNEAVGAVLHVANRRI